LAPPTEGCGENLVTTEDSSPHPRGVVRARTKFARRQSTARRKPAA